LASQGGDSFLNLGGIMIRRWYPFWPSFFYFISHIVGMGDVRRLINAVNVFLEKIDVSKSFQNYFNVDVLR